ncbi:MAG: glycosyltransferase family 2 protein, partial [Planctomycetota bacterium]
MLSIVIVSYNTRDLLDECLASIARHCNDAEVIIVDNGSRDDSVDMVRQKHPSVKLIDARANLGFAGANNRGIQEATGDYVLLLNSDTILEDDSLQRCVTWMENNPRLGAISPSLIGMDDNPQRAYHAFPSLKKRFVQAFVRDREIKLPEPDSSGWLAGTALMIRREALEQIGGGLDGDYWMYWEDADTSAHLLSLGWDVEEYTDAHIRHYGGASGGGPDAGRRSDLYAHYAWGEHRWFFKHRPLWESTT